MEKKSCLNNYYLVLLLLETLNDQQRFYGMGLVT
jgi:hypothetical protein